MISSIRKVFQSKVRFRTAYQSYRIVILGSNNRHISLSFIAESKMTQNLQFEPTEFGIKQFIYQNDFVIFSKTNCPFCMKAKSLFSQKGIQPAVIEVDQHPNAREIGTILFELTGQRTYPNIFAYSNQMGGFDDVNALEKSNKLDTSLNVYRQRKDLDHSDTFFNYDAVVIGGGSGGIAFAKEFASYGMRVALFDFVVPSPMGTKWGLGGTCVNVGCIPKKLMHQAAIHRDNIIKSSYFGFNENLNISHDWSKMITNINNYIRSLNFGYRSQLKSQMVTYINALAKIKSQHEIYYELNGQVSSMTTKYIILATGERPIYPDIPGKQFGISSDDLFWLKYPPGKTLIIGASYVALECAGALHGMGFDVTVMVRSILLRGYDQDMAERIGKYMVYKGIKFIRPAIPLEIQQIEPLDQSKSMPGRLRVIYSMNDDQHHNIVDEYNTVIFAVGRVSCNSEIGLENISLTLDDKKRVVTVDDREQCLAENVFVIGDLLAGKPQLTPVAIKAGQLLAKRLAGASFENTNYSIVPTTVFTPIEYGAIGISEAEAKSKFGEDDVEVYFNKYQPLEDVLDHEQPDPDCYFAKLIVRKSQMNKVIGLHILSPNAGEITQGYAVALRMNATLTDFKSTFGIHPTVSEVFTNMNVSQSSGKDIKSGGC